MTTFLAAGDDWAVTLTIVYSTFSVIVIAAVTIAILDFRGMLKRARAERGACRACGYDLRGADHERCPECGDQSSTGATNALTSETARTSPAS